MKNTDRMDTLLQTNMANLIHPDGHPLREAERHLRLDSKLASIMDAAGLPCELIGVEVPRFHVLVKTIIDQQLSVKAAAAINARLLQLMPAGVFMPQVLLELGDNSLRLCGLSRQKVRYLRAIAVAEQQGMLQLDQLDDESDEECIKRLCQFLGIGVWSAEIFLMFGCQRMDLLPLGDLALRRALQKHYYIASDASRDEYIHVAEAWRPYRSIASWYLWAAVDS